VAQKGAYSLPDDGIVLPKHVGPILKKKEVCSLLHLLVILYIFDNSRYKNKKRFCICCRFAINLLCGLNTSPRDDVAIHVNPRFNENLIVRNSLQKAVWGKEERYGPMPLARGQGFEILILCDPTHYKVSIIESLVLNYVWLFWEVQ
jgi:hypothetical protein